MEEMELAEKQDFFISYAHVDKAWAEWIAWQLEAAGYTTIFHEWDFHAGSNSVLDTHQATIRAERTIAVLSPDYLASPSTSAEWTVAFHRDPTSKQGLLLPVQVEESNVEGLLGPISYIDLIGLDEKGAKHTLLESILRERRKPVDPPSFPPRPSFPGPSISTLPVWNIPYSRNDFFVGREDILSLLNSQFRVNEAKMQTISGLGGIGKTQIALRYAYENRNKSKYNTILWLSAETLQKDAYDIAQLLNLLPEEQETPHAPETDSHFPPDTEQPRKVKSRREKTQEKIEPLQRVKKWLESNAQWLLIVDNVEDSTPLQDILPSPGRSKGHILLTTRQSALRNLTLIPVGKVTPDEGAEILLNRVLMGMGTQTEQLKKENREFAKKLSDVMDGLPLALDQARAYIQETQCSIKEYLEIYNNQAKRMKQDLLKRWDKLQDEEHPQSVVTTFQISFEKIKSRDMTAAQVLQVCAFLHPDTIPEKIMAEAINVLSKTEKAVEREEIAEAIQPLLRYSLLHRNWGSETYTVHRVLQAVLQDYILVNQQEQWLEKTISILNSAPIPLDKKKSADGKKSPKRSLAQLYITHAQMCATHIKTWNIQSAEAVELLNRAGAYLYLQREYAQAQEIYEELLNIKRPVEGASNLDRARNLGILANLTYLQKDKKRYEEAARRYKEALSIYEREPALDNSYVGQMLQQYTMLLQRWKHWKEAEKVAVQEKQIWNSMTSQEKKRSPWGWIGNLDWSFFGDQELGRYVLLSNLFTIWGTAYCAIIGIPIACAFLFHSWWWGWGSLMAILLGIVAISSDKVRTHSDQEGLVVGFLSFLVLSIIVGIGGWNVGKTLPALWQLTSWPGPLQIILQGVCTFLIWAVATFGLLAPLVLADSLVAIPEYTLLPTFTFTFSLCGLPIFLGLLLHSWWIFAGVLLGSWIWTLGHYFLISRGHIIPYQKVLASFIFGCAWGYLGWIFAMFLSTQQPGNGWQQNLPFLLACAGLSTGFYCHLVAYRLLNAIGTEGNIPLVLEDLWVDFAVASLLKTAALSPIRDWESFYFWQGVGYTRQEKYIDGIACYTIVIRVHASDVPFYYVTRGNNYYLQKDSNHAITDFEKAISLDAQHAPAYNGLGKVYFDLVDYTHAIDKFTQAIAYDPNSAAFYSNRGSAYIAQHNDDLAIADFEKAISLDSKYIPAYHERGSAYSAQHNYTLALADFDKVIALDPRNALAYDSRASIYISQSEYASAIANFSRFIWLYPNDVTAYIRRGQAYQRQDDYTHALKDFEKALELDPKDELAYIGRGQVYFSQGDSASAIADYDRAISLDPRNAIAYFNRGYAYSSQGNNAQAIADLDYALLLNPKYAFAYNNRGYVYNNQGDYPHAIADLDQAISLDPGYATAYFNRGYAYCNQGNYPRAIEDYDQAIRLNPKFELAYRGRGDAYTGLGDLARAAADYEVAKDLEDVTEEPIMAPVETPKEETQNISLVQSELSIDGEDVLARVKQRNFPASWQIYTDEEGIRYFILVSVILLLLLAGILIGVVTGLAALFHFSWHVWLFWLSLPVLMLWGLFTSIMGIGAKGTRLVIMPEGFVYRFFLGKVDLSIHYEALRDLSIVESNVTLAFKDGEQKTTSLSVSGAALRSLENSYLTFKNEKQRTFFIDGKAVLARVKQGDIPTSWQVHIDKNAFLSNVTGGMLSALFIGICLGISQVVVDLFHLHWFAWMWLSALVLWGLLTVLFGVWVRGTRLVIMPEGFVYDTNLSIHYESVKEMSIQGERVTVVFKNGRQKTATLSVTETALQHLQNAYLAFKTQDLCEPFLDGGDVLARVKRGDIPSSWQVYSDPNIFISTLGLVQYSTLFAGLCVGVVIVVATLFHLPWQAWLLWIILLALIFWGVLTTAYGVCFRRCRLVVMPEGFVYRGFLEKEPGLSFRYGAIKEMRVQKKEVRLVFKNGRQKTADFSVSETALQHLQNTYLAFKAQDM